MSMQKSGNVAVFWDYENCPAPNNTSGYAIANSISALARTFGSVKVFKAYLEISDQSRPSLRSELQSSGVSLVDCPHNGRKDVADKMILVDMLSYAIDNPAPSTILLITGDRDFAYALSILKNRHYQVVLVKRPDTHLSLTFQACICFDWFVDIVRQAENPSSQAEQSSQRLPYQRHRHSDFLSNASASEDPVGFGTDTEDTADIVHTLHDGIPEPAHPQSSTATYESPRQDREVSSSPRRPSFSTSRDSTPNSAEKPQQFCLCAPKHQITQSESSYTTLPENTLPKHKSPVRPRSGKLAATKGDATPSVSPFISPAPAPPMTPNSTVAQRVLREETGKLVSPPMSVQDLSVEFVKGQRNNISPINASSANLAISSPSSECITFGTTTLDHVKFAIENPLALKLNPTTSASQMSGPEGSTGHTPVVPPNFVILVEALRWQRSLGESQPLRTVIAERIGKKGATYQKAGVSSFREYSRLAEQADLIEMGNNGGRDWIRLKPKWDQLGEFCHH